MSCFGSIIFSKNDQKQITCFLYAFLNVIIGHVVLCDVASQRADDDHSDDAREEEHNHNRVNDGEPMDLSVLQVPNTQMPFGPQVYYTSFKCKVSSTHVILDLSLKID